MPSSEIRVLLVDPHQIVRQGLRLLVEAEGLIVVGQTGSGTEAVALCARTAPDVALVDPALPDLGGPHLLNAIRSGTPKTRVVVLTADVDRQAQRDLVVAGACGYLLKHIDGQGLLAAIRHAMAGRYRLESSAVPPASPPATTGHARLTRREGQILSLVARGLTNKVIATELKISPSTVRVYLSEILVKLGAANRTEAAMIGVRRGLIGHPAAGNGCEGILADHAAAS